MLDWLTNIPHVNRIRFHTRFSYRHSRRLDDDFLSLLTNRRVQFWFVLHINHPNELDEEVFARLKKVQCLGIPVLNQSVLLKGVNDDLETQKKIVRNLS